MAGAFTLRSSEYEPTERIGHTCWEIGSNVLVHGGVTKEKTKQRLSSVVEIFDAYKESWKWAEVAGETPANGVYLAASASVNSEPFMFGGSDGSRFYNSLHKINCASPCFEVCPQDTSRELPMEKQGAGMVAFDTNLAVFGGYGMPQGTIQPGSSFIRDKLIDLSYLQGWTNELHIYNLNEGMCRKCLFHYN